MRLDALFAERRCLIECDLVNCQRMFTTVLGRLHRVDPVGCGPVADPPIHIVFLKNPLYFVETGQT